MKILLLISEVWNDAIHPNNNMSNWFEGMEGVEIATIYSSPGLPYNNCCKKYFRFTEIEMVRSVFGQKAGKEIKINDNRNTLLKENIVAIEGRRIYDFFKKISSEPIRLIRDLIWRYGRLDEEALKHFILDFNPDIIFTQRKGSIKMCRIEQKVKEICKDTPFVAFTGDDEYSLDQTSFSPTFWLRRLWLRSQLKKTIPLYDLFYSMSVKQMDSFKKDFGIETKFLVKCGAFSKDKIHNCVGTPVKITYVGKLYCNRWKTLSLLADCIREVNKDSTKIILQIYTRDKITKKISSKLDDGLNSIIKGPLNPKDLFKVYRESDIALHVESLDKKYGQVTKYSFSTKIIDCLSSGCAIMAIGRRNQAGCAYLKEKDAAFVASERKEIIGILNNIVSDRNIVCEYSRKAYKCGVMHHERKEIQKMLYSDFNKLIHQGEIN